ncbi:MAG TPA: G1 family glutamic endopeptidase [Solirubrobacteraceae bacterium]
MKPTLVIPTLAVSAACALGAIPATSAAADVQQASSENWSGYVTGGSSGSSGAQYKTVSGSWIQPTAKCTSGSAYSAFWVGLGGTGQTEALEQDGTEANCSADGTASYYAWYELVPSAPVKVALAVHPGDHITSRVTVNGTDVTVAIDDITTGQSFGKTLTMSNPDTSSAEWIAEAPSACQQGLSSCTPLPLTDFGTVTFTNASATTTAGHTGTISDPDWSASAVSLSSGASSSGFGDTQFASQESAAGATPSSLSADGSSFSVAWSAAGGSSASDTSGSAGAGGYPSSGYGNGYGYGRNGGYGGAGGYGYAGGGYGYAGGGYGYAGGGYGYSDGGYGYSGDGYSAYSGY